MLGDGSQAAVLRDVVITPSRPMLEGMWGTWSDVTRREAQPDQRGAAGFNLDGAAIYDPQCEKSQ